MTLGPILALFALQLDFSECGPCSLVKLLRFEALEKLVHHANSRMSKAVVQLGELLLGIQAFGAVVLTNPDVIVVTDERNLAVIVKCNCAVQLVSPAWSKTVLIAEPKNER